MPRLKDLMKKSHFNTDFLASLSISSIFGVILLIIATLILQQTVMKAPNSTVKISKTNLSTQQYTELKKSVLQVTNDKFITANLRAINKQVTSLSWVDEVSISRNWHKGITIDVLPKRPIAKFGSEKFIDVNGEVFYPANLNGLSNKALVTLQAPLNKSTKVMEQMQLVNKAFAPLDMAVEDMILTPRMTWLIRFDSGMRILVDGDNTAYKLLSASQILRTQLYAKHNDIASIDLRYKNGFAISWK